MCLAAPTACKRVLLPACRLVQLQARTAVDIEPAKSRDLPEIRAAYAHARAYQHGRSPSHWPEFSNASILAEVDAGRLFKITEGAALVGIFSVADEDAAIWAELERGEHLYLHRIARAATYPGRGLFPAVLTWARGRCAALGRAGLRMDTWADNAGLIAYYERHGFRVVGHRHIGEDPRLPPHYHRRAFTLLQDSRVDSYDAPERC